jgi:hypothetical protein
MPKQRHICPLCSAGVLDGFENCRSMFNSVLAREYSDPAFGENHLFTVDAYALQHSEQHGPRSNAFHLMRLCWLLEQGENPSIRQIRKGGRGFNNAREEQYKTFPFLEPPSCRGVVTVASVVGAATAADHNSQVRAWAQSVWDAWAVHHRWAREQVTRFFGANETSTLSSS